MSIEKDKLIQQILDINLNKIQQFNDKVSDITIGIKKKDEEIDKMLKDKKLFLDKIAIILNENSLLKSTFLNKKSIVKDNIDENNSISDIIPPHGKYLEKYKVLPLKEAFLKQYQSIKFYDFLKYNEFLMFKKLCSELNCVLSHDCTLKKHIENLRWYRKSLLASINQYYSVKNNSNMTITSKGYNHVWCAKKAIKSINHLINLVDIITLKISL